VALKATEALKATVARASDAEAVARAVVAAPQQAAARAAEMEIAIEREQQRTAAANAQAEREQRRAAAALEEVSKLRATLETLRHGLGCASTAVPARGTAAASVARRCSRERAARKG
jgi:hypothetical protein